MGWTPGTHAAGQSAPDHCTLRFWTSSAQILCRLVNFFTYILGLAFCNHLYIGHLGTCLEVGVSLSTTLRRGPLFRCLDHHADLSSTISPPTTTLPWYLGRRSSLFVGWTSLYSPDSYVEAVGFTSRASVRQITSLSLVVTLGGQPS